MIYQRLAPFPALKIIYTALNIVAAIVQTVSIFFLYPCMYPIFDGVTTFAYVFIFSSILMVGAYMIQNISTCFCSEPASVINYLATILSFAASIAFLVAGIIFSPLIGHQEQRQIVFIAAQIGFLLFQLIKFTRLYKQNNGKLQFFSQNNHNQLGMNLFAILSWTAQLIGTLFFVNNVYNQELTILAVFFYGISSICWSTRTWILTQNAFKISIIAPQINHKKQPQTKRLFKNNNS